MSTRGFEIPIPNQCSNTLIQSVDGVYQIDLNWGNGIEICIYYPSTIQDNLTEKAEKVLDYIKSQLEATKMCEGCSKKCTNSCEAPQKGTKEFIERFNHSQWYIDGNIPISVKNKTEATRLFTTRHDYD
ncbi:MAG: hypothetical protein KAJ58_00480 [Candidatus Pacebacteria bacterium]|nr:hypothetical protein [Candidatus Paceibacterota bacterium]